MKNLTINQAVKFDNKLKQIENQVLALRNRMQKFYSEEHETMKSIDAILANLNNAEDNIMY